MDVQVTEIKQLMRKALADKNYSDDDIDFIIELYLGGQLRGHTTHGLAPFPAFVRRDFSHCRPPEVIVETHCLYMVDAHSNPGILVGKKAADQAMLRARDEVFATAIVRNMCDWVRPGAIAQYIAEHDMVSIVTNDGSGRSIAPPGGYDPTVGTSPLAYGIPTIDEPLVVEMATSKRAWGHVRLARKFDTDLPAETYLTNTGSYATKPDDVHSVLPFGEHKGFAIALLIEIMNGSMIGDAMMPDSDASDFSNDWPENSGTIIVFDPQKITDMKTFKQETNEALTYISSSNTFEGQQIRIPGVSASEKYRLAIETDHMEISEEIYDEIAMLASN